jgi:hypothetical protein
MFRAQSCGALRVTRLFIFSFCRPRVAKPSLVLQTVGAADGHGLILVTPAHIDVLAGQIERVISNTGIYRVASDLLLKLEKLQLAILLRLLGVGRLTGERVEDLLRVQRGGEAELCCTLFAGRLPLSATSVCVAVSDDRSPLTFNLCLDALDHDLPGLLHLVEPPPRSMMYQCSCPLLACWLMPQRPPTSAVKLPHALFLAPAHGRSARSCRAPSNRLRCSGRALRRATQARGGHASRQAY